MTFAERTAIEILRRLVNQGGPESKILGDLNFDHLAMVAAALIKLCPECENKIDVKSDCNTCLLIGNLKRTGKEYRDAA